ncbi:MAG: hypothetical protein JW720_15955 [Sedimentisphaerales bacterium]|nr:hypothetical protein [Sedimentisphaerales bacterium]
MKDMHKNPILYYILIPVLAGIWPLLVWGMYLPRAKNGLTADITGARECQAEALEILKLDPDRANLSDANDVGEDFSYATAVDKVAGICRIPATKYKLNTGLIVTKDKEKTQSARLRLEEISVVQFARFLSLIQLRWGTLQCDSVTMTKVKAEAQPDIWTVEVDFKFTY